jgi:hypothetical protein
LQDILGTMAHNLEQVFVTEGVPEFTFVQPPNYHAIFVDVRRSGKPVILEGQSGTGKTTCIKRIIKELDDGKETSYFSGRSQADVEKIREIVVDRPNSRVVIDDFHRLDEVLKREIADLAKMAAESEPPYELTKLVIIGINQVGADLIQLVPDIAKRTGIHRVLPGKLEDIEVLIERGCERLNIEILESKKIFEESRGDYWLTQQLCQTICQLAGVLNTQEIKKQITFKLEEVRSSTIERLSNVYYNAVKDFCRGRRFRPNNQPYFKLLKAVSNQDASNIDLSELANANPDVRGSINNLKEHRLQVLINEKPIVARYFYYNNETKNFAIEDPALFYFIKHLDWESLRKDSGFRDLKDETEFEVALSFAGENRKLAREIAKQLTELDVVVFIDEQYEANYLGKIWSKEFKEIFGPKSRFVVCLLDENHLEKIWPTFERDIFKPRVAAGAVVPIYLDETKFVGIPDDVIGISFKETVPDADLEKKVFEKIVSKLIDFLDR